MNPFGNQLLNVVTYVPLAGPKARPAALELSQSVGWQHRFCARRGVCLPGAPGEAWRRGKRCRPMRTSRKPLCGTQRVRNPARQRMATQPEPSVAWWRSDPPCEAYTGSVQAA